MVRSNSREAARGMNARNAFALLRASDALSCATLRKLAVQYIEMLWPSALHPCANPLFVTYVSTTHVEDSITVLTLARQYDIPGVLKAAYYHLLCTRSFWDRIYGPRKGTLGLPDADVTRLQDAQLQLGQAWACLLNSHPRKAPLCPKCQHDDSAADAWGRDVADWFDEDPDDYIGAVDDVVRLIEELRLERNWCDGCLDERVIVWKAAKEIWWNGLDVSLQTDQ